MIATAYRPRPAAPRRASARIQARRVFLLARLLTVLTVAIFLALHAVVAFWIYMTPVDDSPARFDGTMVDLRVWAGILLFWAGVIALARRPLRLDA